MRFATVAEVKNRLSEYLANARQRNEPILITHHGRPYALVQPLSELDLEGLDWKRLTRKRLAEAWEDEPDALYAYLQARPGRRRERAVLGPDRRKAAASAGRQH
jgi:prevent-host-death family protein